MKELIKELESALEEELALQKKLVALAETKRDALINIDSNKVEIISREEGSIVLALTNVGQRRVRAISAVAKATTSKERMPSITSISKGLDEPYKTRITELSAELKKVITHSARINKQNRMLIENSLLHIKDFFNAIGDGGNSTLVYTRRGIANKAPSTAVIDAIG